jgi:hypothetical protein
MPNLLKEIPEGGSKMVRTVITLLLLAVFFLSGTLYGMNQGGNETNMASDESVIDGNEIEEKLIEEKIITEKDVETVNQENVTPTVDEDLMMMENEFHLTQKTASFLETSVQGFYEVVVGIMYHVADIFF